jgi:hypothetical protein
LRRLERAERVEPLVEHGAGMERRALQPRRGEALDRRHGAVDAGQPDVLGAQDGDELGNGVVGHDGQQHLVGRRHADGAADLRAIEAPAEQRRRVGPAMADAQSLDDGQRDGLLGGAGGEQIPRVIGERADVVAEAPGHARIVAGR